MRIFGEEFKKSYLNIDGIDLFVKILVFVKILSQWRRRKEEISILRSVSATNNQESDSKISFCGYHRLQDMILPIFLQYKAKEK